MRAPHDKDAQVPCGDRPPAAGLTPDSRLLSRLAPAWWCLKDCVPTDVRRGQAMRLPRNAGQASAADNRLRRSGRRFTAWSTSDAYTPLPGGPCAVRFVAA